MNTLVAIDFAQADVLDHLLALDHESVNRLDFGVIGFDTDTAVRVYNSFESKAAGLSGDRVLGHPLFTVVALCMNNFMVAHRFEEAADAGCELDVTIDYVLTLRMRPVKVQLRLLARPGARHRYVLVNRKP